MQDWKQLDRSRRIKTKRSARKQSGNINFLLGLQNSQWINVRRTFSINGSGRTWGSVWCAKFCTNSLKMVMSNFYHFLYLINEFNLDAWTPRNNSWFLCPKCIQMIIWFVQLLRSYLMQHLIDVLNLLLLSLLFNRCT